MLQGEESIVSQHGGIRMVVDSEYTAFVRWFLQRSRERFQSGQAKYPSERGIQDFCV
jgi:hypothetical protein